LDGKCLNFFESQQEKEIPRPNTMAQLTKDERRTQPYLEQSRFGVSKVLALQAPHLSSFSRTVSITYIIMPAGWWKHIPRAKLSLIHVRGFPSGRAKSEIKFQVIRGIKEY
jgi:hypothetical protein